MGNIIAAVISLLSSFFKGDGLTKGASVTNGLIFYGAIAYGVYWFFNGAELWMTTMNGRELIGAIVGGSLLLQWFLKLPPPQP